MINAKFLLSLLKTCSTSFKKLKESKNQSANENCSKVICISLTGSETKYRSRLFINKGYGMVWYGMVWYGTVWYGMVWYGMVWYGMVWYGISQ